MSIKIPFTEKFLWAIYNNLEKVGRAGDTQIIGFPRSMKDALYQDAFILRRNEERERARKQFHKLIYNLKMNGYFKTLRVNNQPAIMLTQKGIDKMLTIRIKLMDKKPRKDGKWQMVLFDIPENKRRSRDLFRMALRCLGYKKLQKSIWVCPYEVERETRELIKRYKLWNFVDLLLVSRVRFG